MTKIFEKEAVWAIISTMLDDVGPTMLDPFKQGLRPKIAEQNQQIFIKMSLNITALQNLQKRIQDFWSGGGGGSRNLGGAMFHFLL